MNKDTVGAILIFISMLLGMLGGYQMGKIDLEKERYKNLDIVDSLKREISDQKEIIKYDTIMIQGERTIDTIKIYYKIKQNEAKNDTSAITIYHRFENLLSKNRNRANKRGK